ncbi:MAG: HAD hydrolase family protein [Candidatus Lokiarchaeota archaeon]|nr:HAD hydrolase family protein [Candidatus Lokiarchaeota archaeon]
MKLIKVCAWDLEGPLSMTDFAAELFKSLENKIDNTNDLGELFYLISNYDDYLIDYPENQKRLNIERYDPGDTLRLLAPFYVNYFDNKELIEIASKKLGIIPGAKETISALKKEWDVYIISTSYTQFAYQVAEKLGVQKDHVYCTKLDIDELKASSQDLEGKIDRLINEIFPKFINNGKNLNLVKDDLNDFFWNDRSSGYYKIMQEIVVRGGRQKEIAIEDIAERTGCNVGEIIATGDSITDINMLNRIKREKGIAVSFNGNNYSLPAANIALTTPNVMGIMAVFHNYNNIWSFIKKWNENFNEYRINPEKIDTLIIPEYLKEYFIENNFVPRIDDLRDISNNQKEKLISIQKEMRKKVRGWVGGLG